MRPRNTIFTTVTEVNFVATYHSHKSIDNKMHKRQFCLITAKKMFIKGVLQSKTPEKKVSLINF